MSQWMLYIILSAVTGSPVLAAVILLVGYWSVDRFTFGILPDPVRRVKRFLRGRQLERMLQVNPHDRRARYQLADYWLSRRRYQRAMETLRPNLEAGDDDAATLFLMGVACLGSNHPTQGEALFEHAEAADAHFGHGAIALERGRWRVARKDFSGARSELERYCRDSPGTIEGRVLLAEALLGSGEEGAAALMREEAWANYASAPRFQRRRDRTWAWKAKPSRPILYGVAGLVAILLFGSVVAPTLSGWAHAWTQRNSMGMDNESDPAP